MHMCMDMCIGMSIDGCRHVRRHADRHMYKHAHRNLCQCVWICIQTCQHSDINILLPSALMRAVDGNFYHDKSNILCDAWIDGACQAYGYACVLYVYQSLSMTLGSAKEVYLHRIHATNDNLCDGGRSLYFFSPQESLHSHQAWKRHHSDSEKTVVRS